MLIYPDGLLFADAVTHLPGQVNVANGEKTSVDVVVDRLFIQHGRVGIACADVVNGLPLTD